MGRKRNRIIALLITCVMLVSVLPLSALAVMVEGATDVGYEAAAEGMVLVKNEDEVLPISGSEVVSIFGRTQVDTIRGGTGSGNVTVSYAVSILDGIRDRGDLTINEELAKKYEEWCSDPENAIDDGASGSLGNMGADACNPEMPISQDEVAEAAGKSDVALIVIGRNTGEGGDHEAEAGDYYLSDEEEELVQLVTGEFDRVVAVMNIGAVMDMSWAEQYGVDAVLMGWQGGNEGGNAVADALSGKVNPSGRLTDTFAKSYNDYPASEYYSVPDAEGTNIPAGELAEAVYAEDIYVGYRYFETFAQDRVLYPFGYGLSYTTFTQRLVDFSASDDEITVSVRVTNRGDVAGKDVVQVYYSAPQGELGKPAVELAAYGKTDTLGPGQSQDITLTYNTGDMACYDDAGKVAKSAWVLEPGEYAVCFGQNVRELQEAGTYQVDALRIVEQLTEQLAVEPADAFQRMTADGYETVPTRTVAWADIEYDIPAEIPFTGDMGYKLIDVYNGTVTMEQFVAQLDHDDLVYLTQGRGMDIDFGGFEVKGLPDAFVAGVAGGYGYDEGNGTDYGIPAVSVADGPAGLRIVGEECTQFPMGLMVACTWNEELMEKVGEMVGKELRANGVDGWLAPALNIHRDPLLGRFFEYYSEDPLVSGVTAAAVTRGVQAQGVGVTLKHFAANNEEDMRMESNSIVSERALREIYLKGFEIAVKTAEPWYIMSSYNQVNGRYSASNYELQTNILRKEWGFTGTVMTDWIAYFDDGTASMIRAQNDLQMPGAVSYYGMEMMGSDLDLDKDVAAGKVTVAEAQRSAINILNSAIKSAKFSEENGVTDNLAYTPGDPWFSVTRSGVIDNLYVITASANAGGTVPAETEVAGGESAEIAVVPDEGYRLVAILIDGVTVDLSGITDDVYTIRNVEADHVLRALFIEDKEDFAAKFNDVNEDDWFYEAVDMLTALGMVEGVDGETYAPGKKITRAEFTKLMYELTDVLGIEVEEVNDVNFGDVDESHWAYGFIGWAYETSLVKGYDEETFGPDDDMLRQDMALFMKRFFDEQRGYNLPGSKTLTFDDQDEIEEYAEEAVEYVVRTGLMQGHANGEFGPVETSQRSHVAQVIFNYLIF